MLEYKTDEKEPVNMKKRTVEHLSSKISFGIYTYNPYICLSEYKQTYT